MIKRAGLAAMFLMLLSTASVSAAGKTVDVNYPNFSPAGPKIGRGNTITWHNLNGFGHTATSDVNGLWTSVNIGANSTTAPLTFNQAGTFLYHCQIHSNMHGKIKVKMTATPATGTRATTFTLNLSVGSAPAGFTHDVQVSRNGGAFMALPSVGTPTTTFKASSVGNYKFRTRLRATSSGQASGWSPTAAIKVN